MFGVACSNSNILSGVMFTNLMKILINPTPSSVVSVFDSHLNTLTVTLLNIGNIYFNIILLAVALSF